MNIQTTILPSLLLIIICPLAVNANESSDEQKEIFIVFRYDDYSSVSSTEIEIEVIDIFRKTGLPVTFGVIPFAGSGDHTNPSPQKLLALSNEKASILKHAISEGIVEVAQHGYSHRTERSWYDGGWTEFADIPYEIQLKRIINGKQHLENILDVEIELFIPPFNKCDHNTLRALGSAGFKYLSARTAEEISGLESLAVLPYTCLLDKFKKAVEVARNIDDPQPVIVVLFHDYDFIEVNPNRGFITVPEFEALVQEVSAALDVRVMSVGQALKELDFLNPERYEKNREYFSSLNLLPLSLQPPERSIYLSPETASRLTVWGWSLTSTFYFFVILLPLVSSFISFRLVFRFQKLVRILFFSTILLGTVTILLALRFYYGSYRSIAIPAGIVSVIVGMCLAHWRTRKSGKNRIAAHDQTKQSESSFIECGQ